MARTLDPAELDRIVAGLELTDLATLERMMLAARLILNDLESWLRRLAGDDDSWLNRLADLIGSASGAATQWSALDVLFVGIPVLVFVVALCVGAIFLWRRRTGAVPNPPVSGLPGSVPVSADVPVTSLPPRDQPAVLFHRACLALANNGLLSFEKDQTNSAIARAARVSGEPQASLTRLARAADRAMFGGWLPGEDDLRELQQHHARLEQASLPR